MKKVFLNLLVPSAMLVLLVTGCKKDNNSTTKPEARTPTQIFGNNGADALLAAVNTVTTQEVPFIGTTIEINLGTAVAAFFDAPGSSTYLDAGTVTCQDSLLAKQSGNSYVYNPGASSFSGTDGGISYGNSAKWNVTGNGAIPAFSYTHAPFPTNPVFTTKPTTVPLNADYTLTINPVSGADSIIYVLASGDTYLEKRTFGNVYSVTFTAAEMATLSASDYGLIQVSPYNYSENLSVIPGKKTYFVNMSNINVFAKFQ